MVRNDAMERECARTIKEDYSQISADGNEAQNSISHDGNEC